MCQGDFVSISEWSAPYDEQCQYDDYSGQLCIAAAVRKIGNYYEFYHNCTFCLQNNSNPVEVAELLSNITKSANKFDAENLDIAITLTIELANNENLATEVYEL